MYIKKKNEMLICRIIIHDRKFLKSSKKYFHIYESTKLKYFENLKKKVKYNILCNCNIKVRNVCSLSKVSKWELF